MKKEAISIYTISDFFLSKKSLTPKRLQKLVYYSYAWFIALNNNDEDNIESVLFNEQPEAWVHGPVFRSLYSKYKDYYWNEIPKIKHSPEINNDDLIKFLNRVWNTFKDYSADELEYMTHKETPWRNARLGLAPFEPSNNKIALKDMFVFYNSLENGK